MGSPELLHATLVPPSGHSNPYDTINQVLVNGEGGIQHQVRNGSVEEIIDGNSVDDYLANYTLGSTNCRH